MISQQELDRMVGKVFTEVSIWEYTLLLENKQDRCSFRFYHQESWSEQVYAEVDIGNLSDLVNSPILSVKEKYDGGEHDDDNGTNRNWISYEFETTKGIVIVYWEGRYHDDEDGYGPSLALQAVVNGMNLL